MEKSVKGLSIVEIRSISVARLAMSKTLSRLIAHFPRMWSGIVHAERRQLRFFFLNLVAIVRLPFHTAKRCARRCLRVATCVSNCVMAELVGHVCRRSILLADVVELHRDLSVTKGGKNRPNAHESAVPI